VFVRAKTLAIRTQCMSNMKQIGIAISMYVDDWNGYIPYPYNENNINAWDDCWREKISPYLKSKQVLICPVPTNTRQPWETRPKGQVSHYGMNVWIAYELGTDRKHPGWVRLSRVNYPSQTILVSENFDGDWSGEPWNDPLNEGPGQGRFYPYHSDGNMLGGVFIFCDTHARFLSELETEKDDYWYWKIKP
jgi:hypothetical protein